MDLLTWKEIRASKEMLDAVPQLKDLYNLVTPNYAAHWKTIGTLLDIPAGFLDGIEGAFPINPFWCCNNMLKEWLDTDTSASWRKIILAIDSPAVVSTSGTIIAPVTTVHPVVPVEADTDPLEPLFRHSRERYIQTRYISPDDTEDIWQLLYPEHFVNVLLIHHLKRRSENEILKVADAMMGGLSEYSDRSSVRFASTFKRFSHLQYNELIYKTSKSAKISDIFEPIQKEDGTFVEPKMILIDGAPGMGKTTLCKEIAYRWAKGLLLNKNSLVFLIFLRDPAVQKIYEFKDLINYFYNFEKSMINVSEQYAEMLFTTGNIDTTIILDGYDEFSDDKGNLLVTNIIKRKTLMHCKVVVTSRPIASENLQKISDVRVEVLGFTEESKKSFIEQELRDNPDKVIALKTFIHTHSNINASCYIPIMMTILVCTFKEYDELPNDESELYEKFVSLTISRFLQKLEASPPTTVLSLQNLPQRYKEYLSNLSKFAFVTIKTKNIVFTAEDVEAVCSNFAISFNNFHGLGLLNFSKFTDYGKQTIDKRVSYNFVHLSIQEYLAAYYISSLEPCHQFQLLKSIFFADSYMNTWIMFIKMNKSFTIEFQHMLCYSHVSGATSEDKHNMWTKMNSLNLFKSFSTFRNLNTDNAVGKYQIMLYKENKQNFLEKNALISKLNYDTYWLFYNLYVTSDYIKVYLSLCNTRSDDSLFVEGYLVDKNTKETTYHNIVAELAHNHKLAVLLESRGTLLGYRATSQQICDGLIMNDSLSAIILRDCHITTNTASVLGEHLIKNNMLKILSIEGWKVNDSESSTCFIKCLRHTNKLTNLALQNIELSQMAYDLADVIKNNTSLEELYLCDNNMQSSAVVVLQALKENSNLKTLDLSSNNMSGKIADSLADVIKNNTCLEELILYNNNLQLSAIVIFQALTGNPNLKVLNFNSNNMSGKVVDDLADTIKNSSCLEELYLANNNLQSSVAVILEALKKSSIKAINIRDNNIPGNVMNDFGHHIRNLKLTHLYIAGNDLLFAFTTLFEVLWKNCLVVLYISDTNLATTAVDHLVFVIKCNFALERLWLGDNMLQRGLRDVAKACCSLPNVKAMDFSHNSYSVEEVFDLVSIITSITSIEALMLGGVVLDKTQYMHVRIFQILNKLSNSSSVGNGSMFEIFCLEMQNYLCSDLNKFCYDIYNNSIVAPLRILKYFSVINQCITHTNASSFIAKSSYKRLSQIDSTAVIFTLTDTIKRLVALDLEYSNIGEEAASKLAAALHHNDVLMQLWLKGNVLCDKGAELILTSLQTLSTLIVLDLSFNNITSRSCDGIAAVINSNHLLEQLWLDGNSLLSSGIVTIAEPLKCHSRLILLSLSSNGITDDAAEEIAEIIINNVLLEGLSLSINRLQSTGICKIAKALSKLEMLRKLDLFNNLITKDAADDLAVVINSSTNLQELHLGNNMLETTGVIKILDAAKNICSLRVLTLSNNNVTKEAASGICDVVATNFSLGILLVGGNDLQTDGVVQIAEAASNNKSFQLLVVCDNDVDEQKKEDIKMMFSNRPDLKLYI